MVWYKELPGIALAASSWMSVDLANGRSVESQAGGDNHPARPARELGADDLVATDAS